MDFHLKLTLVILGVIVLPGGALGKKYCLTDDDCSSLGGLQCIKSMCEWGICGCARGKISRYMGTDRGFQCIKLARVGEKCNEDSICGADGSECDSGVCVCSDAVNTESRWGGEACLAKLETYNSETCSDSIGDSGSALVCQFGTDWWSDYEDEPIDTLPDHPLDLVPNIIACDTGKHTELVNDFDDTQFVGGKVPLCVTTRVGDICLSDLDCQLIQYDDGGSWDTDGASCVNNVCKCIDATHVPDITGLYCSIPLAYGETCATDNEAEDSDVGVCNGNQGLRCGDPCDLDMLQIDATDRDLTCVCDAAYTTSGDFCTARLVGDSCFGDQNCKAIGLDAVCTNGLCKSAVSVAALIAHNWVVLVMTLLVAVKVNLMVAM